MSTTGPRDFPVAPRTFVMRAAFLISALCSLLLMIPSTTLAIQPVTEFSIPGSGADPTLLAVGADGNIWFTEYLAGRIGRITPDGVITEFDLPNCSGCRPNDIVLGPDGNMWFTEFNRLVIGRIAPDGSITEYPATPDYTTGITVGSDDNLWFCEYLSGRVAVMNTSGQLLNEFLIPTATARPVAITHGPDGNLWFAEAPRALIGRLTPGGVFTEFALSADEQPYALTTGPDGNIWFGEYAGSRVGRITPSGIITEFPLPAGNTSNTLGIAAGANGVLWFAEPNGNKIGRITTAGRITEVDVPSPGANPYGVVADASGNVWFTEPGTGKIGRYTPPSPAPTTTTLTSSKSTALTTSPAIFTAMVTATSGAPTGHVEFFDGSASLGKAPVFLKNGGYVAVWGGASLGVAGSPHSITATYLGDGDFAGSASGSVFQAVEPGTYFTLDLGALGGTQSMGQDINDSGQVVGWASTAGDAQQHAFLYSSSQMIDLGTLGGPSGAATAINEAGQIAGRADAPSSSPHAFFYSGGTMTDLGTLGGAASIATAINGAGSVVGYSNTSGNTTAHAFLYSGGTLTALGALGGDVSIARSINDAGQVVGLGDTSAGAGHAFLFSGAEMKDLGTFGGTLSGALDVSGVGEAVGYAATSANNFHAFAYRDGTMTDLGTLGGTTSSANVINDEGQIAGSANTIANAQHAFLFSGGMMSDLGTLGGAQSSSLAINEAGQVAGSSLTATYGTRHAFLSSGDQMIDLGALGGIYSEAYAINSSGQATGFADVASGAHHAVLWQPVPVSSLVVAPASGPAEGSVTLSATLASLSTALGSRTIAFKFNGAAVGSTLTDASGVATLTGVSLTGVAQGSYPGAITASFSGDLTLGASIGSSDLTVSCNPPIASASGTATILVGQETPISGSGGVSCLWSPAVGLNSPNACSQYAAPAVTTTYTLMVTDAAGCVSTNHPTVTITVSAPILPSVITFTTLAGRGRGSDDGVGSEARFSSPMGIAADAVGNLYVADRFNKTIRRISPTGLVSTLAGGGGGDGRGALAGFTEPYGVAVDASGNIYVADNSRFTIRKISQSGVVTTLAGSAGVPGTVDGVGAAARFYYPNSVAVDGAGNVFVSEASNTIRRISPAGVVTTLAGSAGASGFADGTGSAARFSNPFGIATDATGNVYVADQSNHAIRIVAPSGVVSTYATGLGSPTSVAVDGVGNVFALDGSAAVVVTAGAIQVVAGVTDQAGEADGLGSAARFTSPYFLAVDSSGNLFVADTGNQTIRKVSSAGLVTTLAGKPAAPATVDGPGSTARFWSPFGVTADAAGSVYVAEPSRMVIRKIDAAGYVSTVAGSPGQSGGDDGNGAAARFVAPYGVAVDSSGNLFVADLGGSTIRKITPSGDVTTLAGSPGSPGSADGIGAAARFSGPGALAIDSAGDLLVADTGNNTIRRVTPAGVVTTLAGTPGTSGFVNGAGPAARFNSPFSIASDGLGNAYVGDRNNRSIRKVTAAGDVTTFGPASSFNEPFGIAVDGGGNVIVSDAGAGSLLWKVTAGGVASPLAGGGGLGSNDGTGSFARFRFPYGLALGPDGSLYVADQGNLSIRKGSAGIAEAATIDQPGGPTGEGRQLDSSPGSATTWTWQEVRRPGVSAANVSSVAVRNPGFTPDVPDLYVFRLTATDASGAQGITTVSLTALCATISISPATLNAGTMGVPYASLVLSASGGTSPYSYALSGALPNGMSFSIDTLSGTPTQSGSFPITVTATDANGCTGVQTYTLTVAPAVAHNLTITKTGTSTGTVTSSPAGINCGATCTASLSGTVTLTPAPGASAVFGGWSGSCSGGPVTTVTMDADKTCTAAFNTKPDLIVSVLGAPGTTGAGQTIAVTDTTKNNNAGGPAYPGTSNTKFWLSTNTTLDGGDALLGARAIPALGPNAANAGSTNVVIPAGTANGSYFIIAQADGDGGVPETSEGNNNRTKAITIASSDLTVSGLTAPTVAGQGQIISVTDTTKDSSTTVQAPASTTTFYLSTDPVLDAGDVFLGIRAVPALAPGATNVGTTSLTVPASTAGGSYNIIAKADNPGLVAESNETNNTRSKAITIGPNLSVSALGAPASSGAGLTIAVTDTTKNATGRSDAPASATTFYLSSDATLDGADSVIGSRSVGPIASGATNSGSTNVTIPAATGPGTWYVIAKADGPDVVSETSESDNTRSKSIVIGPDLTVSTLAAPGSAARGATISVTPTTKNAGAGSAGASVTKIYLSTDTVFNASDVFLGTRPVGALVPGATSAGAVSVTIPGSTTVGSYFIIAVADDGNAVPETNETNNTRTKPITIN